MQTIETISQLLCNDAVLVGHHDQLHSDQEDARLKQEVMAEALEEDRGNEQDERDDNDQLGSEIKMSLNVGHDDPSRYLGAHWP
jgi:hypothetical protein